MYIHACVSAVMFGDISLNAMAMRYFDCARFILDQLQQLEWGLLVVDEVQVMPARTFRSMTATAWPYLALKQRFGTVGV